MIQNLIFVILFLKILFRAYNFSPHVPMDIIRYFLFQILLQKISKPIKTSEKRLLILQYSFAQKNLTHFANLNSFEIEIICSQNTAKKFSQCTNFPANMFLFGVRKNICTARFPDDQELLS